MSVRRPKALFIGKKVIADFIEDNFSSQWDFKPHYETVEEFASDFQDDNFDREIEVIFFMDDLYVNPPGRRGGENLFVEVVAFISQYSLTYMIEHHPDEAEALRSRIMSNAMSSGAADTPEYYTVSPTRPIADIRDKLREYIRTHRNSAVANILEGREPVEMTEEEVLTANEVERMRARQGEKNDYLGRLITSTSSKGGSGKSSVALVLATYLALASRQSVEEGLAERPLKVLVLDLDVKDGQIGFMIGDYSKSVISIFNNEGEEGLTEDLINDSIRHVSRLGIDALLAPRSARAAAEIPPRRYAALISQLRKMYDVVIMDTSVNYTDPLFADVVYPMADQIIFVTDVVHSSIMSMARWNNEVTNVKERSGMGIDPNKIGVIVNKAMADISLNGETISKAMKGLTLLAAIPNAARLMATATNMLSMDFVLRHDKMREVFGGIARAVISEDEYPLSKNIAIDE